MAGYRGHLAFAGGLGFVYGGLARQQFAFDPATAALGAAVTTIGGLLPDLDSDSGVPVRETFGLASAVVPLLLMPRLLHSHLSEEQVLISLLGIYALIRYGFSQVFKRLTVHRGMFHSLPGMVIAGLCVFLAVQHPQMSARLFLAAGVMIGFLSHLVLDELCSVDFQGLAIKLKSSAGSALKFWSPSIMGTAVTYLVLLGLGYLAARDYEMETGKRILPFPAAEVRPLSAPPHSPEPGIPIAIPGR
jgi:membrane-bound metal-dependent hydrolase YbcI (DUF457 family)